MALGRGDHDAVVRRVYREHAASVYAFFAYSVPHPVAEDLTSGTFERVLRFWPRYNPSRASERTWVLAIARNLLTDHFRRQSLRNTVSTDENPAVLDGLVAEDGSLERTLETGQLREWLDCLSDREREILALRYAGDLPAADIAAMLGLSSANVHQILSRSLRRLRELAQGQRSTLRSITRVR